MNKIIAKIVIFSAFGSMLVFGLLIGPMAAHAATYGLEYYGSTGGGYAYDSGSSSGYTGGGYAYDSGYTGGGYAYDSGSYYTGYTGGGYAYDDWLSCGLTSCGTHYTYTPTYTYNYEHRCSDECSISGQRQCSGNGYRECYRGGDGCLYWSGVTSCGSNETCNNGSCVFHPTCSNECSVYGQRRCSGNGYQECRQDSYGCLKWDGVISCASDETCSNGSCIFHKTCSDECSVDGQRRCSGNGYQECHRGYDGCFKWDGVIPCAPGQTCSNGSCLTTCQDECGSGQRRCNGNGFQVCGNFDTDSCTEWGDGQMCAWGQTCSNGYCQTTCQNECTSGQRRCSGNGYQVCGNYDSDNCTEWGDGHACASDETCTDGYCNTTCEELEVSAGSDKEIDEDESVTLDGSVDGDYDEISWSCDGGDLSDRHTLRPTFSVDEYDSDNYDENEAYTCTLTASNECDTDSDSVEITVNREVTDFNVSLNAYPKSGCAPLNDVDLTATISNHGSYDYDYTYRFDCENDGDWDKSVTTDETSYTAYNLCDYDYSGSRTARVRVESRGRTASDTEIIRVDDCEPERETGRVKIQKWVQNLSTATGYQASVTASPSDTVSYKIVVTAVEGDSDNISVRDVLPANLTNIGNVQTDGSYCNEDIASGIALGRLNEGQTRIITFTARVAGENSFNWGQTALTNTATVYVAGQSADATATVYVFRHAVMGATTVSTGFDDNALAAPVIAAISALLLAGFILRKKIARRFDRDPRQALAAKIAWVRKSGW